MSNRPVQMVRELESLEASPNRLAHIRPPISTSLFQVPESLSRLELIRTSRLNPGQQTQPTDSPSGVELSHISNVPKNARRESGRKGSKD
ncbi:unnamed protein product [Rhodiola kirilowii]